MEVSPEEKQPLQGADGGEEATNLTRTVGADRMGPTGGW